MRYNLGVQVNLTRYGQTYIGLRAVRNGGSLDLGSWIVRTVRWIFGSEGIRIVRTYCSMYAEYVLPYWIPCMITKFREIRTILTLTYVLYVIRKTARTYCTTVSSSSYTGLRTVVLSTYVLRTSQRQCG